MPRRVADLPSCVGKSESLLTFADEDGCTLGFN